MQGLGGELAAFNFTISAASSSGQCSDAGHSAAPPLLLFMGAGWVACEEAALDNRSLHQHADQQRLGVAEPVYMAWVIARTGGAGKGARLA